MRGMVREDTLQAVEKIPDTTEVIEKIKRALKPFDREVKFAFLFGSYARREADIWSDVDIGIYFAENVTDDKRNQIRFSVVDAVAFLEAQIAYLDNPELSPEIFIAALNGVELVMSDEDTFHRELMKNIHRMEDMKLIGLIEEDQRT